MGAITIRTIRDDGRERETLADGGRPSGVEYHPAHGLVLSREAYLWQPAVRRFYEERLPPVFVTAYVDPEEETQDEIDALEEEAAALETLRRAALDYRGRP